MTPRAIACGFIGLGSQGAPIAQRMIDAGFPTRLWARRAESLDAFRKSPAILVSSITELATHADHVGVCVSDDRAVREVCEKLIPSMRPGCRVAIHSTTLPATCVDIGRAAAERGLVFIEAPVSGGAPAALAGRLSVMVGGTKEALDAARPILETFATSIVHVGEVGSAQAVKLLNNSLMAAQLGLAHSAAAIAQELGLSPATTLELLCASSARSYALEIYARHGAISTFTSRATLAEKVRLLGEVLGSNHPTAKLLRDAARPLGSCASEI